MTRPTIREVVTTLNEISSSGEPGTGFVGGAAAIPVTVSFDSSEAVACPNKSGPMFALELASFMELNHGKKSKA